VLFFVVNVILTLLFTKRLLIRLAILALILGDVWIPSSFLAMILGELLFVGFCIPTFVVLPLFIRQTCEVVIETKWV
jgi:hypothetical protein